MRLITLFAVCLFALLLPGSARAACSLASNASASLGTAGSYAVKAGQVAQTSAQSGLTCTGAVLSVLSTNYARASASSTNGFRLRANSSDTIAYRLSADPGGTFSFNQGATIDYFDPTLISLLGLLDKTDFAPPIYVNLTDMPNTAAGTYTDIVTIQWSWRICGGVGVGGVCILTYTGSGSTTLRITLVVTSDCRIDTPDVRFGSAPLVNGFVPVTQAARVDCTKGSLFTVAFSSGQNGTARPWRTMTDGGGNRLNYNLYRPDGITIWDETNPLADPRPGTGGTTPSLLQTFVARIDASQPTPPPGSYSDVVTLLISF
ncbi:Csu type fimbrial protein [Novosphingopyxis iocasae]|uniref:Csu type fimbrial protein n=1 Tax=Novosphingopyxis iocasae TaxID=2762729 RepID=UPI00165172CB|nr:spore coat U domain-containing protein [Novosphingopyxis iocasae]